MTDILGLTEAVKDLTDKIQYNEELIQSRQCEWLDGFEREELELIKQECKKMAELRHIYMQRIRLNEADAN